MAEKKLSEELRQCLEDDACGDCQYHKPETKTTCWGLLQKAYEVVKRYEEMYEIMRPLAERLNEYTVLEEQGKLLKLPCSVGGDVYGIINQTSNYDGAPYRIVTVLNFRLDMLNKIGKTVFLTRPEAEAKLAEMERKK